MAIRLQLRRDTEANWLAYNPILAQGELSIDLDSNRFKVGDGTHVWSDLPWMTDAGAPNYAIVRNQTGSPMYKGQAVYTSGANGDHVQVSLARANSDATSARTMGILAQDIPHGTDGLVCVGGYLEGVDTSAYTVGSIVYLSGTTAGAWNTTKPHAPTHLVYLGVITRVGNSSVGSLYVHPQNGYELDEIHDVDLVTNPPTSGQVLTFNGTTNLWEPGNAGGATAYVHNQNSASTTWTIVHNLPIQPNITTTDVNGNVIEGSVVYTNSTTITVSLSQAYAGYAYLS